MKYRLILITLLVLAATASSTNHSESNSSISSPLSNRTSHAQLAKNQLNQTSNSVPLQPQLDHSKNSSEKESKKGAHSKQSKKAKKAEKANKHKEKKLNKTLSIPKQIPPVLDQSTTTTNGSVKSIQKQQKALIKPSSQAEVKINKNSSTTKIMKSTINSSLLTSTNGSSLPQAAQTKKILTNLTSKPKEEAKKPSRQLNSSSEETNTTVTIDEKGKIIVQGILPELNDTKIVATSNKTVSQREQPNFNQSSPSVQAKVQANNSAKISIEGEFQALTYSSNKTTKQTNLNSSINKQIHQDTNDTHSGDALAKTAKTQKGNHSQVNLTKQSTEANISVKQEVEAKESPSINNESQAIIQQNKSAATQKMNNQTEDVNTEEVESQDVEEPIVNSTKLAVSQANATQAINSSKNSPQEQESNQQLISKSQSLNKSEQVQGLESIEQDTNQVQQQKEQSIQISQSTKPVSTTKQSNTTSKSIEATNNTQKINITQQIENQSSSIPIQNITKTKQQLVAAKKEVNEEREPILNFTSVTSSSNSYLNVSEQKTIDEKPTQNQTESVNNTSSSVIQAIDNQFNETNQRNGSSKTVKYIVHPVELNQTKAKIAETLHAQEVIEVPQEEQEKVVQLQKVGAVDLKRADIQAIKGKVFELPSNSIKKEPAGAQQTAKTLPLPEKTTSKTLAPAEKAAPSISFEKTPEKEPLTKIQEAPRVQKPKSLTITKEHSDQQGKVKSGPIKQQEKGEKNVSLQQELSSVDVHPNDNIMLVILVFIVIVLFVILLIMRLVRSPAVGVSPNASEHQMYQEDEDYNLSGPEIAERLED